MLTSHTQFLVLTVFLEEKEFWKCQNISIWGQFAFKLHLTMLSYVTFLKALEFLQVCICHDYSHHRHPVILLATVHHGQHKLKEEE